MPVRHAGVFVIRRVALALLVVSAVAHTADAQTADPAQLALGGDLFRSRCAFCHGDGGRGDGPAGVTMIPRPPDFASAGFWRDADAARLRDAILNGVPGSAMMAYGGTLSAEQLDALLSYLEAFHRTAGATP